MDAPVPDELRPVYEAVRSAFSGGVASDDYMPLLVALHGDLSDEALGKVVAAVTGKESIVVNNDHAAAMSSERPSEADIERVIQRLRRVGYRPE